MKTNQRDLFSRTATEKAVYSYIAKIARPKDTGFTSGN
jgi:hypothetical protein